jgi:hypothetical protein
MAAPATERDLSAGPGGLSPARFALLLGLLLALIAGDVIVGGRSFFYRDFGLWAYPNACYHRQAFWAGEIPLWNPLNNCGLPFLAQWNTLTLYPGSLLYLLLPLPWSLNVFCLAHLWLAGVGMYLLAHRWTRHPLAGAIAGLAFALNGLTLHSLMWPNNMAALGWAPWVILSAERAWQGGRRRLVLAAVLATLQILAGAPEIVALTWCFLGLLLVGVSRQNYPALPVRLVRFVTVAALALGLAALQLVPFLELARLSQRSSAYADATWSMPPWGIANFLVPLFHETKSVAGVYSQDAQQWTSSYYLGIGPLALAVLALGALRDRRIRLLAATAALGLLLSMGANTPLLAWAKSALPALGMVRFPIKFVFLVALAVPLLAACATQRLSTSPRRDRFLPGGILAVGAGLWFALGAIAWVGWHSPITGENRAVTLASAVSRGLFLSVFLLLLAWHRFREKTTGRAGLRLALLATMALDILTHAPRQNPTIPTAALEPRRDIANAVPAAAARVMIRVEVQDFMDHAATPNLLQYYLGQRRTFFGNCNLIDGVGKVNGVFSLHLRPAAQVQALCYGHHGDFPAGLADFLGVGAISSLADRFGWEPRRTAQPLVTGGQRVVFLPESERLAMLARPGFDGGAEVYLDPSLEALVPPTGPVQARIEPGRISAHRVEFTVTSPQPSVAVVAQTYHPAWRAKVNGREAPLRPANHAFQCVTVPAGTSQVLLRYDDRWFQRGLVVSIVSTLLGVCLMLGNRARTRG